MSFDIFDGLADPAKEVAASCCDYVQELMDLDDFPASGRLGIAKDLNGLLQDLREKGARVYSAKRDRKFRGADWGGPAVARDDDRLPCYRSCGSGNQRTLCSSKGKLA
jgi:hypothetical protein